MIFRKNRSCFVFFELLLNMRSRQLPQLGGEKTDSTRERAPKKKETVRNAQRTKARVRKEEMNEERRNLFTLSGTTKRVVETYTANQLKARADEYTSFEKYDVFVGTWNVNGKIPKRIKPWLKVDSPPDIYALSFQEFVDLNTVNVVSDVESASRCAAWEMRVPKSLRALYQIDYELIASKYMVGLCLLVFAKKKHVTTQIRQVMTTSVATGIAGVVGNKGAVGVSFRLHDSRVCLLNAHFAAHRDNVKARNENFAEICTQMEFSDTVMDAKGNVLYKLRANVADHDAVLWAGDLNYRIQTDVEMKYVYTLINTDQLHELRKLDQLNVERAARRCFVGFKEKTLTFPPTYKVQVGKLRYDRRPDKKMRCPAWCDRVLWRAAENNVPIRANLYESIQLVGSDHLPVRARFDVAIRMMDREKRDAVVNSLQSHCTTWAQSVPRLVVVPNALAFGTVKAESRSSSSNENSAMSNRVDRTYINRDQHMMGRGVVKSRRLRLMNTSSETPIRWSQVESHSSSSWLRLEPSSGLISPARTIEIVVSIVLNAKTCRSFVDGTHALSDVLVIRPYGGTDIFVPVAGCFEPSCLNFTIRELLHLTGPIRAPSTSMSWRRKKTVPTELWRLLHALNKARDTFVRDLNDTIVSLPHEPALDPSTALTRGARRVLDDLESGFAFDTTMTTSADLIVALWHVLLFTWHERLPLPNQRPGMTTRAEQDPIAYADPMMSQLSPHLRHTMILLVLFVRSFRSHDLSQKLSRLFMVPIVSSAEVYSRKPSPPTGLRKTLDIACAIFVHLVKRGN